MKVTFQTIRYKNFLSTGNSFVEFKLDQERLTLINGINGSGKSTILEALSFGLFGKSWRGINKPNLVNSINKHDMVVEVEFRIKDRNYLLRRGVKPAIFEIYQDGELFNQTSSSKDYQEFIEKNILKLDFKTFTQVVILGCGGFVPFMQLPAASRRDIIEELLDIKIFSKMNVILKSKIVDNKTEVNERFNKIKVINEKLQLTDETIHRLEVSKNSVEIDEIQKYIRQMAKKLKQLISLSKKYSELSENYRTKLEHLETVSKKIKTYQNKNRNIAEKISSLNEKDVCTECGQAITEEHKLTHISEYTQSKEDNDKNLTDLYKEYKKYEKYKDKNTKLQKEMVSVKQNIFEIETLMKSQQKSLDFVTQSNDNNIFELKKEKSKLTNEVENVKKEYEELIKTQNFYSEIQVLLKDSGIKTDIISIYIPYINEFINTYLNKLEFMIDFTLDTDFNEKILSGFRDDFQYSNFSQGEKQRIDLALILAWRKLAKMRNSIDTNILILDEILDSSLDPDGCLLFLNLLKVLEEDVNIFVISHRPETISADVFESVINVKKYKNFTVFNKQ